MFSSQFTTENTNELSYYTKTFDKLNTDFFNAKDEEKRKIKREKNNLAVKKCREARRLEEKETAQGLVMQQILNEDLEKKFIRADTEYQILKQLMSLCWQARQSRSLPSSSNMKESDVEMQQDESSD